MRRITLLLPRSPASLGITTTIPTARSGPLAVVHAAVAICSRAVPRRAYSARRDHSEPTAGTATPAPANPPKSPSAFYFEAGYAVFAKRKDGRAFPPAFSAQPSDAPADASVAHNRGKARQQYYNGEVIRGATGGDDAVLVSANLIAANDGVGAWAAKPQGHAPLWSRMILHFWALEAEKDGFGAASGGEPDPTAYLQRAYEATTEALSTPEEWLGTTTACGALLHSTTPAEGAPQPVLFVTQLGDSEVLVIRPRGGEIVYKTEEQWHWFDCPRQLGTNSPDTPAGEAVTARVEVAEDDVVLAMSDGVTDNLWEHEVVANVLESLRNAKLVADDGAATGAQGKALAEGMQFVATQLAKAARVIAQDPFAESPFMERAVDEGLPMEGGKPDDISVVAAICKRRS